MRRVLCLVLVLLCIVTLAACGDGEREQSETSAWNNNEYIDITDIREIAKEDFLRLPEEERTSMLAQVNSAIEARNSEGPENWYIYLDGNRRIDLMTISTEMIERIRAILELPDEQEESTGVDSYEQFDYPASICMNYRIWADLLGVPDFDDSIESSTYDETGENSVLYVDDLAVVYDYDSMETEWVALFYLSEESEEKDINVQALRSMALYAALELGKPDADADGVIDISETMDFTSGIFEAMQSVLESDAVELMEGHIIPYYTGRCGTYYVSLSATGIMIMVRQ